MNIGELIDHYQEWVDYDMKRYGKISDETNRDIEEAGLQIVKDKYGDYEVIAGKYNESLKGENGWVKRWNSLDKYYKGDLVISKISSPYEAWHIEKVAPNGRTIKHLGNYKSLEVAMDAAEKHLRKHGSKSIKEDRQSDILTIKSNIKDNLVLDNYMGTGKSHYQDYQIELFHDSDNYGGYPWCYVISKDSNILTKKCYDEDLSNTLYSIAQFIYNTESKSIKEGMTPSQSTLDDCLQDYRANAFGFDGVEDYVETNYPSHPQEFKDAVIAYLKKQNEGFEEDKWSDDELDTLNESAPLKKVETAVEKLGGRVINTEPENNLVEICSPSETLDDEWISQLKSEIDNIDSIDSVDIDEQTFYKYQRDTYSGKWEHIPYDGYNVFISPTHNRNIPSKELSKETTLDEAIDGWDNRTGVIKRIDKYLYDNPEAIPPKGYIQPGSRAYDDAVSRYGDYVTTPFGNISTDDLMQYARDNKLLDESKYTSSLIGPDSLLMNAEEAYFDDNLGDFVADTLNDGSATEEELLAVTEKSSFIEYDDMLNAIDYAKSLNESFDISWNGNKIATSANKNLCESIVKKALKASSTPDLVIESAGNNVTNKFIRSIVESQDIHEGTSLKRIARYNEFDNGNVLHNYEKMTSEEAEEKAKQASLDNPDDIYYVAYDDIMDSSSDLRWINGKSYNYSDVQIKGGKPYVKDVLTNESSDNSDVFIWDGKSKAPMDVVNVKIQDGVTSIRKQAFNSCTSLKSVVIPNSVTSIDRDAFEYCYRLKSINIPNSVTSIGESAFNSCTSLTSIVIPNSVTSIGDRAFHWCRSLTSINIPDSVTSIGEEAFSDCISLENIKLPKDVKLGKDAFKGCTKLKNYSNKTNESIEDNSIEDIDKFVAEVKEKFPGSEAIYDGDTNTIKITLDKVQKENLTEDSTEVDELETADQKISSANTSINSSKLPAIFRLVKFEPDTLNLDYGGGKFDNAAEYLAQQNVTNLVYDPYNRSTQHNAEVLQKVRKNGGADTITISNVLNVIAEPEARLTVLRNAKKLVKPGGNVYITVYEGNKSGEGTETKSGYQLNKSTADYIDEIASVFSTVNRKGKLIIAK